MRLSCAAAPASTISSKNSPIARRNDCRSEPALLGVTLIVSAEQAEALSDALLLYGALSVDIADHDFATANERALYAEPFDEPGAFWLQNRVNALFDDAADVAACVAQACAEAGVAKAQIETGTVEDCDWLQSSREQFRPIKISERLWIVPSWLAADWQAPPPDKFDNAEYSAPIALVLDPGLAFGSGEHPTTQLCLRWLDENLRGGESVLDYGCGSGILAIAALKLGASSAAGIDIDPNAVVASQHNAVQNRVDARFCLPPSEAETAAPVDVVVANILANPLIALAPLLAQSTAAGGKIVLSGILSNHADAVAAAYRPWFNLHAAAQDEGWVCLSGKKC
ncbi:MAG: 50S ribosomal protein L11 methyltransferase [Burkholderiales bacterium]|nr:50S ribosomal protein L11 methyltransferase [Burkholderiales bacterium]